MREWVAVEAPERILPTLFYILTLLAYFTHHARILFVVLAWVFVIFRLLHAYVHVTSNIANLRGMLFGLGSHRDKRHGHFIPLLQRESRP
jgi:hypothetical protein